MIPSSTHTVHFVIFSGSSIIMTDVCPIGWCSLQLSADVPANSHYSKQSPLDVFCSIVVGCNQVPCQLPCQFTFPARYYVPSMSSVPLPSDGCNWVPCQLPCQILFPARHYYVPSMCSVPLTKCSANFHASSLFQQDFMFHQHLQFYRHPMDEPSALPTSVPNPSPSKVLCSINIFCSIAIQWMQPSARSTSMPNCIPSKVLCSITIVILHLLFWQIQRYIGLWTT